MSKEIEIRTFDPSFKIEEREEGKRVLTGVAIHYNSESNNLPFVEKILPGAFTESLRNLTNFEVLSMTNHDRSQILGRTSNGSLRLYDSPTELRYEVDIPNTSYGNDLIENVRVGNIAGNSIGFAKIDDYWEQRNGTMYRELREAILTQTSPEVTPAYSDTSVALRSLENFKEEKRKEEDEKSDSESWKVSLKRKELELKDKQNRVAIK